MAAIVRWAAGAARSPRRRDPGHLPDALVKALSSDLVLLHHSTRERGPTVTRAPRPDFLVIGAPKAGTTALHAALAQHPGRLRHLAQGAEVLALRRRPAPGLGRAGGQALAAGVDLARRPLLPALRARRRPPGARREHAVLPVEPRRPPPDRRVAARRPAHRRGPRPGRPGLQQLDAPVVRRPRARGRLRDRLRAPGRARAGGVGAVLALPRARDVRRAARRTCTATSTPSGSSSCATATSSTSRGRAVDRVSRFLGIREGLVDSIPRDNSRSFVPPGWRPRVLGPVVRGGARLGQFAPPEVWRRLHPPLVAAALRRGGRGAGRASTRCSVDGWWRRTPTTSTSSAGSPGRTSATGSQRRAAGPTRSARPR